MNLVFLFEFKNDVHWVRFVKMPCHIATLPCIIWNTSGIAWYRVIKASVTNHFLRQTLKNAKHGISGKLSSPLTPPIKNHKSNPPSSNLFELMYIINCSQPLTRYASDPGIKCVISQIFHRLPCCHNSCQNLTEKDISHIIFLKFHISEISPK